MCRDFQVSTGPVCVMLSPDKWPIMSFIHTRLSIYPKPYWNVVRANALTEVSSQRRLGSYAMFQLSQTTTLQTQSSRPTNIVKKTNQVWADPMGISLSLHYSWWLIKIKTKITVQLTNVTAKYVITKTFLFFSNMTVFLYFPKQLICFTDPSVTADERPGEP